MLQAHQPVKGQPCLDPTVEQSQATAEQSQATAEEVQATAEQVQATAEQVQATLKFQTISIRLELYVNQALWHTLTRQEKPDLMQVHICVHLRCNEQTIWGGKKEYCNTTLTIVPAI